MQWIVYCDGYAYGFFKTEADAFTFAEKELPVGFSQGLVKVAKFQIIY